MQHSGPSRNCRGSVGKDESHTAGTSHLGAGAGRRDGWISEILSIKISMEWAISPLMLHYVNANRISSAHMWRKQCQTLSRSALPPLTPVSSLSSQTQWDYREKKQIQVSNPAHKSYPCSVDNSEKSNCLWILGEAKAIRFYKKGNSKK